MKNKPWLWTLLYVVVIVTIFIFIALAFPVKAMAASVDLQLTCIEDRVDRFIIHLGYNASETVDGTSWFGPVLNSANNAYPPNVLQAGQHADVVAIEIYAPVLWQFVYDTATEELNIPYPPSGPSCDSLSVVWHPGAVSIYIPMTANCNKVYIIDDYGHWSQVTSNNEPVILHYGEALIGSNDQPTDPARYKTEPVECF